MKLEFPLLGLMAAQRMSGYDIKKWLAVEGKFSGFDRHASQIYRELNRMQVERWIEFDVDARDSGPDAKVYRVTDAGFERLTAWLRSGYVPPERFQDPEFIYRLRFSCMLDTAMARELVLQELEARRRMVQQNRGRSRESDHLAEVDRPEIDADWLRFAADATNAYGEASIDQWIDWLESLLARIDDRLLTGSSAVSLDERAEVSL